VFAFAGLSETWRGDEASWETCTNLTTMANELVRPVHDRMPVIVPRRDFTAWLDPAAPRPEELHLLFTRPRTPG
jgi:putative SOS response-associated peptidase YedK